MQDQGKHFVSDTRAWCWLLGLACACGLISCSRPPGGQPIDERSPQETGIPVIYVVNYPLAYFAERIGQPHVHVFFPAPANEDPAFWMPGTETIVDYQNADLVLLNGASYAKWVDKVSLPPAKVVDTSASFRDQLIATKDTVSHTHGPGGAHSHSGRASTTWLDPTLAMAQTKAVLTALVALRPQHKNTFQRNFAALERDLRGLDARLVDIVNENADRPVVFSHPVYQYFVRRYDLVARSVPWEPDEVPSEPMWADFQKLLEEHPAQWMIWESEPLQENVERLRELGVESITFDPCGNTPDEGDYTSIMQRNMERLARVFASGNE